VQTASASVATRSHGGKASVLRALPEAGAAGIVSTVGSDEPMANSYHIDLAQPRSVGEILAATVRVYRRYPLLFVILALAVMAPYKLVVLGVTGYGPLRHGHENAGVWLLLTLLDSALITPLISALHMQGYSQSAKAEGRDWVPSRCAVSRCFQSWPPQTSSPVPASS
jgi:hypothetical protein